MDNLRIVIHIIILYMFYTAGSWIREWFELVIPGSIIGMLLLLACFSLKIMKPKYIQRGTALLLSHMPVLFLPITTGVIIYLDVFTGASFWLVVIAFVSTMTVMAVSGWTAQTMARRREQHD
ncbi:CidA/LrgA family protein [Alteribacillus sp. HJP-4]|uniref:CidA/LrgA family protein n=1 Tax=Alteribacillus sp. HJP-4 TaxID=2775394 RepID=UPI0035CD0553